MNVAITGARGFLGRDIVRTLRAAGHVATGLVRQSRRGDDPSHGDRPYDLSELPSPMLLDGIDAVVHCAFAPAGPQHPDAYAVNVDGTMRLFALAAEHGVPFLFISSFSAIPEARSVYGRQKYELETRLSSRGACIVRPGLVVGNGGLVRDLVSMMRARHVLPLVDGGLQPVQCIWLADIAAIVVALVERRCPARTISVATAPPLTSRELACDIRSALRIRAATVSIPYRVAYAAARLLEAVGLRSPLAAESLLGLRTSRIQPVDDVRSLGVSLMPWGDQCASLRIAFSEAKAPR